MTLWSCEKTYFQMKLSSSCSCSCSCSWPWAAASGVATFSMVGDCIQNAQARASDGGRKIADMDPLRQALAIAGAVAVLAAPATALANRESDALRARAAEQIYNLD